MGMKLYFCDTETTGLSKDNSIIELSIMRLADDTSRTWLIKADENPESIQDEALRVNGHLKDDILHKTSFGRQTYIEPEKAIADIENWLAEDNVPTEQRILAGQNVSGFDSERIMHLWDKYGQMDTYPFNKRLVMDTLQIELFLAWSMNDFNEYYNLKSLAEKYKIKTGRLHKAEEDTRVVKEVFLKQVERVQKLIK